MNRRAFVASLFIAPVAPRLAKLISPPQLTLAQQLALQTKRALEIMRLQVDRAMFGIPYHQSNSTTGSWLGFTRK